MSTPDEPSRRLIITRRAAWVGQALRAEAVGGILALIAATIALLWANSDWSSAYENVRDFKLGYGPLRLDLAHWSSEGLLALFFFVAGLELKYELVDGDLSDLQQALPPVAAAVGGVAIPAMTYLLLAGQDSPRGWAIPTATDIAFALAVLAIASSHIPTALRSFLLTMAVVDDLIAIIIIAIFYPSNIEGLWLATAFVPLLAFAWLVRRARAPTWLVLPLAGTVWGLFYLSGIHATVAGLALAMLVPARAVSVHGRSRTQQWAYRLRPWSASVAVPVFALMSTGVVLTSSAMASVLSDRSAVGIFVALLLGKPIGVLLGAWLATRWGSLELDASITWGDITGVSVLAGVGFTVSLLISELAFGAGTRQHAHAQAAILAAAVLSATCGAAILRHRERHYRGIAHGEGQGENHAGAPTDSQ